MHIYVLAFLTKSPFISILRNAVLGNPQKSTALHFTAVEFFEMNHTVTDDYSFDQALM